MTVLGSSNKVEIPVTTCASILGLHGLGRLFIVARADAGLMEK